VKNNYPTVLDNVRLSAKVDSDAVKVTVSPDSIAKMLPGDKNAFTIALEVKDRSRARTAKLSIGISANQVGFQPAEAVTKESLLQAMKDDNPSCKVLTAELLAGMKDQAGMKFLKELLAGQDRNYKARAIRAVGRAGDKGNVTVLTPLLADRDGWTKGNALLALGNLKAEKGSIQGFTSDRDSFVRTSAMAALSMHGVKSYDGDLTSALRDSNPYVRAAAGWGLAARGNKSAIKVLDETFQSGNDDVKIFTGDALIAITERVDKS
jgi:HEAT repeat protein